MATQPPTIVTSVSNAELTNFVSEEVVIDEPVIVATSEEVTSSPVVVATSEEVTSSSVVVEQDESVQVLVQDDVGEIVTMPETQEIVQEVGGVRSGTRRLHALVDV